MLIYIILGLVIIIFIFIFIVYNDLIKLNNKVKEAFSTMDVYLKKRWDLIPNIVEAVKGYAEYEKSTLENVVRLRSLIYDDMNIDDKIKVNEDLSKNINRIMALIESYPELKASDNFKDLSMKLTKVEDDIANSRKYYNGVVRIFNNKVEMFPSNLVAKLFGYKSKPMFKISADERDNVKLEL